MDFALLKELLTNIIEARAILNIDQEKVDVWEKMLSAIPAYEINSDGAIKEWLHGDFLDNYHHRHQSHIYPLFPGYEVGYENSELFEAMRVAVEKRLVIGLKEQTGWSLAHMANIYARLKDGRGVKECLDLLLRFCTGQNLFTYHNDWRNMGVTLKYMHCGKPPYQIDANMGFTSAVYESLLYSSPKGTLEILPALPTGLDNGEITNLHTQVGASVSIKWNKTYAQVSLFAKNDTKIILSSRAYASLASSSVEAVPCGEKSYKISLKGGKNETLVFTK
jgi:alpha-L-fucosidase 2